MDPALWAWLKETAKVDPYGLCAYRDANAHLAPSPGRVVFLGASITAGWQAGAPSLFRGEVIDRGVPGQTTSQMLLRLRSDVIDLHPAVLHFMPGTNDIASPLGTVLTKANIQSIVEVAQAHGVTVILGSITPSSKLPAQPQVLPAPEIIAINAWMKRYAANKGIAYVDYHTPLADPQGGIRPEYSNEGLHPNQRGYDVMTPLATSAIRKALLASNKARARR